MRKLIFSILFGLLAGCLASAQSFYEPFNYAAGSNLGDQAGWVNTFTGDEVVISSGNLSFPGLPPSIGNSATFGGTGKDPTRAFSATSSTLWYSFLLDVTSLGSLDTTGGYLAGFQQPSGVTLYGGVLWTKSDGAGGYNIGIGKRSNVAAEYGGNPTSFLTGSTVLVVGNYVFNPGTDNDVANLWLNPDPSTFGNIFSPTPSVISPITGTDLSSINRFFFRQGESPTEIPASLLVDELRVGNSWAEVTAVPEPSSALLLGGFGLAGLGVAWRRFVRASKA